MTATEGTAAFSPVARALVYEDAVKRALVGMGDPAFKLFRNPNARAGADAILEIGDKTVLLWIKWGTDAKQVRFRVLKDLDRLRRAVGDFPFVVVTPALLTFDRQEQVRLRFVSAQWRGPDDNGNLNLALNEVAALEQKDQAADQSVSKVKVEGGCNHVGPPTHPIAAQHSSESKAPGSPAQRRD